MQPGRVTGPYNPVLDARIIPIIGRRSKNDFAVVLPVIIHKILWERRTSSKLMSRLCACLVASSVDVGAMRG